MLRVESGVNVSQATIKIKWQSHDIILSLFHSAKRFHFFIVILNEMKNLFLRKRFIVLSLSCQRKNERKALRGRKAKFSPKIRLSKTPRCSAAHPILA
jgi:hypothetical protein